MGRFSGVPSDEELLAATSRDRTAFGVFYERHERTMLGFFGRATRSPELAADLTAETFAAALRSRTSFDSERGTARMWLFGIARNVLSGSLRQGQVEDEARRRLGLEPLVIDDDQLDAIGALIERDGDELVRELLASLPEEQAAAIRAHVIEDRSYREIADELRCSEAVVRQRVSRGLGRLRRTVTEGAT